MQHDDVVWSVINGTFCSHKVSTKTQKFCRNEFNLTGLCTRSSCPLANSQYATVREESGIVYLYMKTAERAHFPNKCWEKVKLSKNFEKAIHQINENLLYWPGFIKQKCKQRFVRITQYLIRMRRLRLKRQKLLVPLQTKIERRETRREHKALIAARIEKGVEKTLLDRLKKGVYQDLYNIPQSMFDEALMEGEVEDNESGEEEIESEVEQEMEGDAFVEGTDSEFEIESEDSDSGKKETVIGDIESSDDSDIEDVTVPSQSKAKFKSKTMPKGGPAGKKGKKQRVEIEYEMETEPASRVSSY
ncbi:PREDICTED: protein MAK16 homolog [Nicrophorus vespilloides]|uniref:Protein MAK16 homolog n=1 Tax=Nicrophorus vespilloides TaxID=110193 RepID=A0ABM1MHU4_NICVS|nr:PREDICTED: protein MAK16 homolog [Nicrophorus vespilloides]